MSSPFIQMRPPNLGDALVILGTLISKARSREVKEALGKAWSLIAALGAEGDVPIEDDPFDRAMDALLARARDPRRGADESREDAE